MRCVALSIILAATAVAVFYVCGKIAQFLDAAREDPILAITNHPKTCLGLAGVVFTLFGMLGVLFGLVGSQQKPVAKAQKTDTSTPGDKQTADSTPIAPAGGEKKTVRLNNFLQGRYGADAAAHFTYKETSSGPQNLPVWTGTYLVDDKKRGVESGTSKKAAKEAAAQRTIAMLEAEGYTIPNI
ncbi:hypothetical protein DFH29DRAFT_1066311 [Suillus ampliporus]|nr:hypothetical protein DFH29DRAFT_1066311 [Suillus ampliporus]